VVDNMTVGDDNDLRMHGDMAHLETERLAREDRREAKQQLDLCPDCGATVIVRIVDEINHGEIRGVCRCLCGMVWEVDLAA
jgi:hypothetical protein